MVEMPFFKREREIREKRKVREREKRHGDIV